jgi:hypothetical protein
MSAEKYERALTELLRRQKEGIGPEDEERLLDELDHLWAGMTPDDRQRADRFNAERCINLRD